MARVFIRIGLDIGYQKLDIILMYRFFEILPGSLTWATLLAMALLSWREPAAVSIFIILFDIYWLLKTIYLSFHLRVTFVHMRKNMKIDWLNELRAKSEELRANAADTEHAPLRSTLSAPNWEGIRHLVIFPMYREPYEVVRESFASLDKVRYPKDKFIVILAMEERGGEEDAATARKIEKEFGGKFGKFLITTHPMNLRGEIPGKGANEAWAARETKRLIIDPLVNAQTYADSTQTNADKEFLYEDLTYKIKGAIFSVRKELGLGHKEIVYQKALEEEFTRLGLNFEREKVIDVLYEDKKVGIYRPDFVMEGRVILELKALPFINKLERRQVWQYLKGSNYKLALLVNFGGNDVYIKRIVYDTAREIPRKSAIIPRESALSQRRSALRYENILVSVFDIDTQNFPDYFSRLTYVFLSEENNLRAIYQPVPLFTNNITQAPALARVVAFSTTFWQMMQQSRPERLTSFSSQSIPLKALIDMDFWETNVVSEDSHVFWQGYLRYNGDFRVVPLEYPVSMDANVTETFWGTMKSLYKQHRRWAWGAENVPYMLSGFRKNKKIPWRKKWYWSFVTIEGFHSWATNALMIFALGWLPSIIGTGDFSHSLLSYNLPRITRYIINASMIGIATSAILSLTLLPATSEKRGLRYVLYLLEWVFIPVTLIVFGALPAIEAQTRLLLGGKYRLGFWVTPKGRYPESGRGSGKREFPRVGNSA